MKFNINNELREKYNHLASSMSIIHDFILNHPKMSYIEFDYYTVHELTLFSIDTEYDFDTLQANIERFKNVIPAIKRIFDKPIIHLTENDDVLPVESVRIINQNTFQHIANHSENVSNITSMGIKPRRLLTRVYEDNYGIYENLIVCNFVDLMLSYCRKSINSLKNLIYASESMEFNLLEKVNHLSYFLALGKLHTGYIRDFNKYYVRGHELSMELDDVMSSVKSRLMKPIYKKNKFRNKSLELKKTNIFLMQKDYHRVYKEFKYLKSNYSEEELLKEPDYDLLQYNYFYYIEILIIFSIGHFNFKIDPKSIINLLKLESEFIFKKWKVKVTGVNNKMILIDIKKSKSYRILLIPDAITKYPENVLKFKEQYKAKEAIILTPFEEYLNDDSLLVSIDDIDSFRRIQQVILRGMIESDTVHEDCPFCNENLRKENERFICDGCRTVIEEGTCKETGEKFFYTTILNLPRGLINRSTSRDKSSWYYKKKIEGAFYFRNITKINNESKIVCPICNKVHEEIK